MSYHLCEKLEKEIGYCDDYSSFANVCASFDKRITDSVGDDSKLYFEVKITIGVSTYALWVVYNTEDEYFYLVYDLEGDDVMDLDPENLFAYLFFQAQQTLDLICEKENK